MSSAFLVRVAAPADIPRVSRLLEASYPVLMKAGYDPAVLAAALPLITRANPALLASGTYYLAEGENGDIAGCGGWTLERPGTGETSSGLAHIRHFATHPDWSRRGVGKAIYATCEAKARTTGVHWFECYASLNAIGFYLSLGFSEIGPMDVAMGPGLSFPSMLMRRSV